MNRNTKQNGLALAAAVMVIGVAFFAFPSSASAQEGARAVSRKVQPIFESKKGWKFEDDSLIFFNRSPNPDGTRFIRWKDYTWVITSTQIVVIDPRPYGTQVQGLRNQMTDKGPQSDKDLMDDLKDQAKDIRHAKDPNHRSLPFDLNIGLGFRF